MDNNQLLIDSLNKVISVQSELIANLKSEIERLKLSQTPYTPITPGLPFNPYIQPLGPLQPQQPFNPGQPYYGPLGPPPYIITSDGITSKDLGTTVLVGDIGPIGSGSITQPSVATRAPIHNITPVNILKAFKESSTEINPSSNQSDVRGLL